MKKRILYEIKSLDNALSRQMFEEVKDCKKMPFSVAQMHIIEYLFRSGKKDVYQKDLEEVLKLRKSTISGILKTMEKYDIIVRNEKVNGGHGKKIILTDKAIIIKNKTEKKAKELEDKLCENISKEEIEVFLKVIGMMKENLREDD